MSSKVQIKGIRDGLLITLGSGSWEEMHSVLIEQIEKQAEFLQGARLALDVGEMTLKAADLGQLSREISDRGLTLWAILSESPTTEHSAQVFGLATRLPQHGAARIKNSSGGDSADGENAVLVRGTLRSGYSIQHPGNVIVIGDVNPGAQVIARGDVVIWGKLRGMVHAGAEGDEKSVVCALDLSPTQLRIAGEIAVTPKRRGKPQPEMARLENGQVIAEVWDPKRERL
jgi:septum site-determining protein MinC